MNLKVGVIGTAGKVHRSAFMDTAPLLAAVGQNTGNLVFQYAVTKSIKEDMLTVGLDVPWDVAKVRQNCRVLVIPSANFLREEFDLTGFVSFLDKVDLPLVFLGIGAQADSLERREFSFHPSIDRLVALLRERCKSIGVRGHYTAELLDRLNVPNAIVIGCPSNFINPSRNLGDVLQQKWDREAVSIATTGDEPWPRNHLKRDAERKLVSLARTHGGVYVQQSVEPFVQALRSNNPSQSTPPTPQTLEGLRSAIAPQLTPKEFAQFLAGSVRLYFDVDQWLEDLARFDLSVGLRLHGNMVPFQAACPAIWVYHDSRTQELAETMSLPRLSVTEFLKLGSVAEMKRECRADFVAYDRRRNELRARYLSVLADHGVAHVD